jgi:hypothetical protein
MPDTKRFIMLYMVAKRAWYKQKYMRAPKWGTADYTLLEYAARIVDDIDGDYADFINATIDACKMIPMFPTPQHLVSDGAIKRYAKRKAAMSCPYVISREGKFFVMSTGRSYVLIQAMQPVDEDGLAYQTLVRASGQKVPKDPKERARLVEDVEYVLAKFKLLGKSPTYSLLRFKEKLDGDKS